jgi:glucosamine kinase
MILIADSGSTKCDWLLTNIAGEHLGHYKTIGFNPLFQNSETVAAEILKNDELREIAPKITHVYYYGASTSGPERTAIIQKGLVAVFTNAILNVQHDLIAAAYTTYNGQPCISCILGTGSNSCFFDGENLVQQVPALGFILGDEASGAYFGKHLMAAFLYNKLPADINQELETEYGLAKQLIFEAVYQKPRPNAYLAGFAPFMAKHKNNPVISQILHKGFVEFITEHVLCYEQGQQVPVHFVGSIAGAFEEYLKIAATQCRIILGNIIPQPIEKLAEYHIKHIFPKLEK